MKIAKISFDHIRQFSDRDKDYQLRTKDYKELYSFEPSEEGLLQALASRKDHPSLDRATLVSVIKKQYAPIGTTNAQADNIEALLKDNTFTVITAHQPALFTGPLYYVTKLYSAVALCNHLNSLNQDFKIVPVFINGSEDHDFEEVNHLNLFNKTVSWHSEQAGAVGRMKLTNLEEAIAEFSQILGNNEHAQDVIAILNEGLARANNYNEFVAYTVNKLFGDTGILFINTDDATLKRAFIPIMQREIIEKPSEQIINETQTLIESKFGYKSQALARSINLFYLGNGTRERIVHENDKYRVLNSEIAWTDEEIIKHLNEKPENFSPNVVTRPLYQETIFPNIAYVGGGGELAYWLERKAQFEYYNVYYPTLVRRNSLIILNKGITKTLDKLNMTWQELFAPIHEIINKFLQDNTEVDLSLAEELSQITTIMATIADKALSVDATLKPVVESESVKIVKQIEHIEGRLKRAVKKNEEVKVNQLTTLLGKIFPNDGLQERTDNFFQYYTSYGDTIKDLLLETMNPLDKEVVVFVEQ